MKNNVLKRVLALTLAVLITLTSSPVSLTAFAEGTPVEIAESTEVTPESSDLDVATDGAREGEGDGTNSQVAVTDANGDNGGSESDDDEETPDDQELADTAIELINDLPSLNDLTLADEANVVTARDAFDTLETDSRLLVTNITDLINLELKLVSLEVEKQAEEDTENARLVTEQIDTLADVESIVVTDETAVVEARTNFEALTDAAKANVTNLSILISAEDKILVLKDEQARIDGLKAEAKVIDDAILALPVVDEITLDETTAIVELRKTINASTDEVKSYIEYETILSAAEAKLQELVEEPSETPVALAEEPVALAVEDLSLQAVPNLFITVDDYYDVYFNGVDLNHGVTPQPELLNGAGDQRWETVDEYSVTLGGNNVIAVKGWDRSNGTATISGFIAKLDLGNGNAKVTDSTWKYMTTEPPVFEGKQWFEPGYEGGNWSDVTIADPNGHWGGITGFSKLNGSQWIWSSDYIGDKFDSPVWFRNVVSVPQGHAPQAQNVGLSGLAKVGEDLTGDYTFFDEDGDDEATSTFKWYYQADGESTFVEIPNAITINFTVPAGYEDGQVKFEVTPVADADPTTGTPVMSQPVTITTSRGTSTGDKDQYFYSNDATKLYKYYPYWDGGTTKLVRTLDRAYFDVAMTSDGTVYGITSSGALYKNLEVDNEVFIANISVDQNGLAAGPSDELYIFNNNHITEIHRLDISGNTVTPSYVSYHLDLYNRGDLVIIDGYFYLTANSGSAESGDTDLYKVGPGSNDVERIAENIISGGKNGQVGALAANDLLFISYKEGADKVAVYDLDGNYLENRNDYVGLSDVHGSTTGRSEGRIATTITVEGPALIEKDVDVSISEDYTATVEDQFGDVMNVVPVFTDNVDFADFANNTLTVDADHNNPKTSDLVVTATYGDISDSMNVVVKVGQNVTTQIETGKTGTPADKTLQGTYDRLVLLAQMQTANTTVPANLRNDILDTNYGLDHLRNDVFETKSNSFDTFVETHDQSTPSEEAVGFMALESGLFKIGNTVVAEADTAIFDQYDDEGETKSDNPEWHTVQLSHTFNNPVVIAELASYTGPNRTHVRIKNVTSNSFDLFLEEWDFDRSTNHHNHELVSYVVVEAGTYTLSNGEILEASNVTNAAFFNDYATTPTTSFP